MSDVRVYYLVKSRALTLQFADGIERTLAPSALIPEQYVPNLLTKQATVGGCCDKPSRTVYLFATEDQLNNGQREWIK